MRYFFEARSHSDKLLPDNIRGDAQRILQISPKAGPFHTKRRTAYSDVREWRKIRFLKQKKHSYLAPRVAKISRWTKGQKGKCWNAYAIRGMLCLPYAWAQY